MEATGLWRKEDMIAVFAIVCAGILGCSGGIYLEGDGEAEPEPELCVEHDIDLRQARAGVLIVLDTSSSMAEYDLWDATRTAVKNIAATYDDEIMFGIATFPGGCDQGRECSPAQIPLVGMAYHTGAPIGEALETREPCGGTPLVETLLHMRPYLRSVAGVERKSILLVTDGAPNCNGQLDGARCRCTCPDQECWGCGEWNDLCLDDARAYAVLDELRGDGITTFVLGLAAAAWLWGDVLSSMAAHGGSGRSFFVEEPVQIGDVFEGIAGTLGACEFELDASRIPDPESLNFYIGGEAVLFDPDGENGWRWAGRDRVEFVGPVCDTIVGGRGGPLRGAYGCPTIQR
jgi:hypothetical protein